MARPRNPPSPVILIDLRAYEMAQAIERRMNAMGLSQQQLAEQSGVEQSQISRFFNGSKSVSVGNLLNLLQVVHGALAIDEDPVKDAALIGTLANGKLKLYAGSATMPGVFLVETQLGPFRPGDRVLVESGPYTPGRWVLVEHPDQELRVHRCEVREGLRLLTSAESVVYSPEHHKVLGICKSRTEAV